ncbi:MAG: cyclically-permuted mutarotase family protein [Muribaculaceae bacterium]|nr:cyclically-permuted mutarotase family protein [Muribaculaceae bacterium]
MNKLAAAAAALLIIFGAGHDADAKTRVACIGNSITYGYGIDDREHMSYPAQLGRMLGSDYEVGNFGHSGATLLNSGHRPYMSLPEFKASLDFAPDIALIHLGINDTDPRNWPNHGDSFVADYLELIDSLRARRPDVRIIIANLSPIEATHKRYKSGTQAWREQIRETIADIAAMSGCELIDFGHALRDRQNLLVDGLHPGAEGAGVLAHTAYGAITGDYGGLKLPPVFSDGMVLQRYKPLKISGSADAGAEVRVSLGKHSRHSRADNRGRWSVELPPMAEAEGLTLTVTDGTRTRTFNDVAIGEVWLASGQSNMEFPLISCDTFAADNALYSDPGLRLLSMRPRVVTDSRRWTPADMDSVDALDYYLPSRWQHSSAGAAARFSAVAWYFGKMLRDSLQVPIGIICNAIGGSGTGAWVDIETLERDIPEILVNWRGNDYLMPWVQQRARENIGEGARRHPYAPAYLFAAGIRPLEAYPIAGVIWYQGESNAHNTEVHERLFRSLTKSWRSFWQSPGLPFIFTQISSIDRPSWPRFRDSQRRLAQEIPGTAMAVCSDLGDSLDVHPRSKRPVGERLARQALNRVYSMSNVVPSGPLPLSAKCIGKGKICLTMDYGDDMHAAGGGEIRGFELALHDGVYLPAKATPGPDNTLIIENMDMDKIRYVRYAWQPFTRANLVNGTGLPASTFKIKVEEEPCAEAGIEAGVSACYAGIADGHIIRAGGCNFPENPMAPGSTKKFYSGIYTLTGNPEKCNWELIGHLPEAMAYGAAVSTPRGLALIGGTSADKALSTAYMLNVTDDGEAKLSALPSLPASVDNMAAACIDSKIYIAGGNVDGQPSNALFCLDLDHSDKGWQKLPPFPGNPRVQPVMAASDAEGSPMLYLWGGFAGKGDGREASLDTDGYRYSPAKRKWSHLPAPTADGQDVSTGGGVAYTLASGDILVAGGVNKDVFLEALRCQAPDYLSHPIAWYRFNDNIFIYSPASKSWSVKGRDASTARAGASAAPGPDGSKSLLIIGGEIKPRIRTADITNINL